MLKPYEVCLSSVDAVYHISEKTRKKLNLGQSISHKVKELQIVCKVQISNTFIATYMTKVSYFRI